MPSKQTSASSCLDAFHPPGNWTALLGLLVLLASLRDQPSRGADNDRQLPPVTTVRHLPVPRAEWKLELVAESPIIKHPSVVCVAPDGRVFVAEDPMDISTDQADAREGRIICLHPDGHSTIYADSLYAVFGMKYLEGKLYVLHNPKFSVFTDDGAVGKDRSDLIESTNPEPWAKDWNDHVPANFTLGMDGYFYVAVGDKGLYGAVGKDGKRVDLHGGGILRLRPDGTGLEIYASGLRNIMDAALDEEDEVFTYDNTDEKQWMSRLSHIVEGGYYGYPYDFHPRQPHILWCMADYGAGAATGLFAETSGRLPGRYEGGLFLGDFGKRQVTHVRAVRQGATFEAREPLDLFPDPPGDFRPVGICASLDGTALYICDWQHRDNKAKVVVGRVFKLTHREPKPEVAFPSWFINAASGKPFDATIIELLEALEHPARQVRLTAQRRLSERGSEAVQPLMDLLEEPRAKSLARCHAIWALDAIDEGDAGRAAITRSVYSLEPAVRRQAVRQLGLRRARSALAEIMGRLEDDELSVRFQATTALGRIADPAAIRSLRAVLQDVGSDDYLRFAAFTALNRIGRANPNTWSRMVSFLTHSDPTFRERAGLIFRDTYDPQLISALSDLATNRPSPSSARQEATRLLASLHRKLPPWDGKWWAYHPVNQPPPEKTVEWEGTPEVANVLQGLLRDPDAELRRASLQAIRTAGVTNAASDLRLALDRERDPIFRELILATLGALRDRESVPLILTPLRGQSVPTNLVLTALAAAQQIGNPSNQVTPVLASSIARYLDQEGPSPLLASAALHSLGALKDPAALPVVFRRLSDTNVEVTLAAIHATVSLGGSNEWLEARLDDPRLPVRQAAIAAVGTAKARSAIPHLLEIAREPGLWDDVLKALTLMPDLRALPLYTQQLTNKSFTVRESSQRALKAIRDPALPLLEGQVDRFTSEQLALLRQVYEDHPTGSKGKLFERRKEEQRPEDYLEYGLAHPGNAGAGEKLFNNVSGLGCVKCHKVNGTGGDIGPDLTHIGSQFDRKALAESVLWPSRIVREGYQQTLLELKNGDSLSGLIKAESAESITLRDVEGRNQTVLKADIQERNQSTLSVMPEGLHISLTREEFSDLLAYLERLKN